MKRIASTLLFALCAGAVEAGPAAPTSPILERNTRTLQRYFHEVWNQGHVDVLDELLTPDYRNHSASLPSQPGPADLKPIVLAMRRGIPDLRYEILDLVVTEKKAAVHLRVTGTHTGEFFGIAPTGKRIDVRQMQIEWLQDGRIAQHWRVTDELTMLRQLGLQ